MVVSYHSFGLWNIVNGRSRMFYFTGDTSARLFSRSSDSFPKEHSPHYSLYYTLPMSHPTMTSTVIICPGAWSTVQFFQPVMQAFEARGYPTVWAGPSGYPEHDPSIDPPMNLDAKYLRERVLEPLIAEGRDVVLFMHSYGGIYGPASVQGLSKKERATKGLKGGVIALLYAAAFVARKGTSAIAAMGLDPNNFPDWIVHDKAGGWVTMSKSHAVAMLYHDLPIEDAEKFAVTLPRQPYSCFSLPVHWDPYDDPHFKGTFAYIFTDADRILPYNLQQQYVDIGGIQKTLVLQGSSHSPHLEQPAELVKYAEDLLKQITENEDGQARA